MLIRSLTDTRARYSETYKEKYIKELDLWVKPGDEIHEFSGANETIGTVVLQCESLGELTECLNTIYDHIRVEVEEEKSL